MNSHPERQRRIAIVPGEGFRLPSHGNGYGPEPWPRHDVGVPRQFYVYILANRSRTLYVGVTNDITRRVLHHRAGVGSRFTNRYAITRLVHVEITDSPRDAIAREKQIKGWSRARKVALIETANPAWEDLADGWFENEKDLCREVRNSFLRR